MQIEFISFKKIHNVYLLLIYLLGGYISSKFSDGKVEIFFFKSDLIQFSWF